MNCKLGLLRGNPNTKARGFKASAGHPRARVSVCMCECLSSRSKTAVRP